MKTVYLGHNPNYAAICHEESDLQAVCWHGGIGGNLEQRTRSMLSYCKEQKIPTLRHFCGQGILPAALSALAPDLVVVGEYHFFLKEPVLSIPPLGVINLHGAPLPRYRGAHPINWMIINGETQGAVTCHYVTLGLDAGDIIDQYTFPIDDTDTAIDVRPRIEETGRRLLADVLRRFKASGRRLPGTPQDESRSLYTPPRRPEDGLLGWNQSPKRLYDFIRAQTRPYPGAFSVIESVRVSIWGAEKPGTVVVPVPAGATVGTVVEVSPQRLVVVASGGCLIVTDWECAGRALAPGDNLQGPPDSAF